MTLPGKQTKEVNEYRGDEYEHEDGDDDGLGFYSDGMKRTLTEEQVGMFRHSEIQTLLREQRQQEHRRRWEESEERDDLKSDRDTDGDDAINEDDEEYLEFLRREQQDMNRETDDRLTKMEISTTTANLQYDDLDHIVDDPPLEDDMIDEDHYNSNGIYRKGLNRAKSTEKTTTKTTSTAGIDPHEKGMIIENQPRHEHIGRRRLLVYSSDHEEDNSSNPTHQDTNPPTHQKEMNGSENTGKGKRTREFIWPRIGG